MDEKFYLLIAGSRDFNDYKRLESICNLLLRNVKCDIVIVSGGARGADTLAEHYAFTNGFELKVFKAKWDKYGKSAGYRRNEEMQEFIAKKNRKGIICFWDGSSKGTRHNFELARKLQNPLRIYNYKTNQFLEYK